MTVIPFPPATDRPKPGKEPPEVPPQILILPVIPIERNLDAEAFFPAKQIVKEGASLQHLWDEADALWPSPAGAGSD